MSEPNIDHLFQAARPGTDWKPVPPSLRPSTPADFGEQLLNLTASPGSRPDVVARSTSNSSRTSDLNGNGWGQNGWQPSSEPSTKRPPVRDDSRRDEPSSTSSSTSSSDEANRCRAEEADRDSSDDDRQDTTEATDAPTAVGASVNAPLSKENDNSNESVASESNDAATKTDSAKGGDGKTQQAGSAHDKSEQARAAAEAAKNAAAASADAEAAIVSPAVLSKNDEQLVSTATADAVVKLKTDTSASENSGAAVEGTAESARQANAEQGGLAITENAAQGSQVEQTAAESEKVGPEQGVAGEEALKAARAAKAVADPGKSDRVDDEEASDDDKSINHGKDVGSKQPAKSGDAQITVTPIVDVALQNGAVNGDAPNVSADDAGNSTIRSVTNRTDALQTQLGRTQNGGQAGQTRETNESSQLSRTDPERFVGRVARAFHFAQERGGTLQLRLSPPELGSLRMELTLKDGALTANLETETPAARKLLLDHLPALRDRLAEQNVRVERFDVDVRRDGQGGQSDAASQQQSQQQQAQRTASNRLRAPKAARVAEATRPEPVRTVAAGSSGINMIV